MQQTLLFLFRQSIIHKQLNGGVLIIRIKIGLFTQIQDVKTMIILFGLYLIITILIKLVQSISIVVMKVLQGVHVIMFNIKLMDNV